MNLGLAIRKPFFLLFGKVIRILPTTPNKNPTAEDEICLSSYRYPHKYTFVFVRKKKSKQKSSPTFLQLKPKPIQQ